MNNEVTGVVSNSSPAEGWKSKRRILAISSLVLSLVSVVGTIGLLCTSISFVDKFLGANSNPESVIGLTVGATIIGLGLMVLFSILGVSLGIIALMKEANKSLAVSGIVLNAILLCLAGGVIGLGLAFIH